MSPLLIHWSIPSASPPPLFPWPKKLEVTDATPALNCATFCVFHSHVNSLFSLCWPILCMTSFLLPLLFSSLSMTSSAPLIPNSTSSSTVLNDTDLCEARVMSDLEEHLNHEGIVAFPVYIHHIQINCWLRKSNAEFLENRQEESTALCWLKILHNF